MTKRDEIILKGLKENNLKNIDLKIQKQQITVFTGLSGSGKSSVVFDTLAAESRRQMTFDYPLYVRNQMPGYERPRADLMQHLNPVVVVEQRPAGGNPKSNIGTYMDINPLIRLLFSRIGEPAIGSATDFSSESSFGSCPECGGFGRVITPDIHKLVDEEKSLRNHAVQFKPLSPSGWQGRWMLTGGLFDPDKPIADYNEDEYRLLVYGPPEGERVFAPFHTKHGPQDHEWDGLLPRFTRLYIHRDVSKLKQVSEEDVLAMSSHAMCPTCEGSGLNPEVLTSRVNGFNIAEFNQLELTELLEELSAIKDPVGAPVAKQAMPSIQQLADMGVGYLSLSRKMATLSGGEAQRVKIARHLGNSLNNLTYIFDEPSAGMHPEEVGMLIRMLKNLKENFNTVIVIEHDISIMNIADEIIDMGPEAGVHGGEVMYQGSAAGLSHSPTAAAMYETKQVNKLPRKITDYFTIKQARDHNLKNLHVKVPKHVLVSICGVSGSGKSTLMQETFQRRYPETITVGQGSIGISSRSTLATYMGIMDDIRAIFAKATGKPAGLFSFNSLGACPVCKGKGVTKPDVAFADPITVSCEACLGTRYSETALAHRYQGKNIIETLALTNNEAREFFQKEKIMNKVDTLREVGLGYLTLGQTTCSLSGGEVQRLKLASHLQKEGKIYLLDEPSLGLHAQDNDRLIDVFQKLVNKGNTVIIIEHNLNYILQSDWVIELGPGGGKQGGYLLFEGTPLEMLEADTLTAEALKEEVGVK